MPSIRFGFDQRDGIISSLASTALFWTGFYPAVQVSGGTTVGSSKFTDQDYADDAVLFSDCPSKWPYILSNFDKAAHTMGLNTSWSKTKIQNLGHGVI